MHFAVGGTCLSLLWLCLFLLCKHRTVCQLIACWPAVFRFLTEAGSYAGAIEFCLYSPVRCGRWLALGASRWKQGLLPHTPLSRFILFKGAVGKAAKINMKAVADEVLYPRLTPHLCLQLQLHHKHSSSSARLDFLPDPSCLVEFGC
jgi:hypothetical protein